MKNKVKYLGAAALGVLLLGLAVGEVAARSSGWLYGRTLRVASTEGRDGTPGSTLGDGDAYIQDDLEVDGDINLGGSLTYGGQQYAVVPATQTVAAGFTVTADACGGLKRLTSTGSPTSDTTNTFTAPSSSNAGCCMDVVNVGSNDILLDANTLFPVTSASALTLAQNGSIRVCSDGSYWRKSSWTEY